MIPDIIYAEQVGYIKNQYIGQNVRIIYHILTHAKENKTDAFFAKLISSLSNGLF